MYNTLLFKHLGGQDFLILIKKKKTAHQACIYLVQ